MEPLNENGYYEETMFYTLKALRNNSYILLATMDVFIKEPTLNWLEHVRSNDVDNDGGYDREINTNQWSPVTKIRQASEKLNGISSVTITIEDLKSRSKDKPEINKKYVEFVGNNLDPSLLNNYLDVSGQVRCLIRHATDMNLLGRMYIGWEPWL